MIRRQMSLEELRTAVAALLECASSVIADDEDLVNRGVDSIAIMRLTSQLRLGGVDVSFRALLESPTLQDWWGIVGAAASVAPAGAPRTGVEAHRWTRVDPGTPFRLTPVQQAYWIGRTDALALGGVGCHAYLEFDGHDISADRLHTAVCRLADRHDMLRARFLDDGRQVIAPASAWPGLTVHDLRGSDGDAPAQETRERLSHRRLRVESGEVFDVQLTLLSGARTRLHINVDLLVADVASIRILLADLVRLYEYPDESLPALGYGFADYLASTSGVRIRDAAREYWQARLPELPGGPQLPLAVDPDQIATSRFVRRARRLPARCWERITQRGRKHGLTPAMVLVSAYAQILGTWSAAPRFVLSLPLFDRQPLHPDVEQLVAHFTNLLLLEVDVSGRSSFTERARTVQAQFHEDVEHADYSAVEVLRDARHARSDRLAAPVVFASSLGEELASTAFRRCFGEMSFMLSQTPQVWIDHQVYQSDGGLLLVWDAVEELFPPGLLDAMFGQYCRLLDWLTADDANWTAPLPVMLPDEQLQVRQRINDTGAEQPASLLHEGFLAQAAKSPHRVALIWGKDEQMTYAELLGRSISVAAELSAEGVRPGEVVGVVMEKGPEQVIAVLSTLLAGAAYLPVDTNQPPARRAQLVTDAGVRCMLTQSWLEPVAALPGEVRSIVVDTLDASREPAPLRRITVDDLAYVIYTSGSTGQPKGVMISHRSAVNTVGDINRRFGVTARDRVFGLASLGFDLSVYDVFGTLSAGGALVLPDSDRRGDPSHWAELIARHSVTVWNSVPAQLQMLSEYLDTTPGMDLPTLRLALLSGDWIPVSLPDRIRVQVPQLRVISLGGATEAAIWSIFHPIEEVPSDWRSIPYGRPLANQSFHVLDGHFRPRPDWVTGELYIGGAGLAQGYLGDPAKTAERFIRHPDTGERLYRTGDLGRYLPDGTIEFLGRADLQVKIRGHRIEPGEIEAALESHQAIGKAIVVVDGGQSLQRRLIAFVEPAKLSVPRSSAGQVPVGDGLATAAQAAIEVETKALDPLEVLTFLRRLDDAQLLAMAFTFRSAGLFADPDSGHSLTEILGAVRAAPIHHRVVRRWLAALQGAGLIEQCADEFRNLRPVDARCLDDAWRLAEQARPDELWTTELFAFFRTCARRLPEQLSGELDTVQLLFPQGRREIARALYERNTSLRSLNAAVSAAVRHIAESRADIKPLSVLEIGAGIGATTATLLSALSSSPVNYLFTDVSQYFIGEAQQRFRDYPWVRYGLFDMNGNYRAQGLEPNSFDVIVAAQVLHNAPHMSQMLDRLRELLTPGGWLIFTEGTTQDRYELMTSMEFMVRTSGDGNEFSDHRHDLDHVFLSSDEWRELLAEAGSEQVICLPGEEDPAAPLGQRMFAACFKRDHAPVEVADLMEHLSSRLPDYMLPAELQVVDALPFTDNGKIDRRRLRDWLVPRVAEHIGPGIGAQPRDEMERALAEQWAQALGVTVVSRDGNFFELGGDSLLAAQVSGLVRQHVPKASRLPFEVVLRQIMSRPTVAGLAELLRETESEELT
jgi:pyochelin synthetase